MIAVKTKDPVRKQAFTADQISQCVTTVELALIRGNKAEALAAIERAFVPPDARSADPRDWLICELDLNPRVENLLESHGITTVGQLCNVTANTIYSWPQSGRTRVEEIRQALQRVGLRLRGTSVLECAGATA